MLSHPIRFLFCSASALVLCASCSQSPDGPRKASSEAADSSAAPNIAPRAAPGVAFSYDYRFNLPDQAISAAQESHAGACERMGLQRCRITGMRYSVDRDENVVAGLDLKLDPALARQFGKSATDLVARTGGRLDSLEIGSSDEGAKIDDSNREKLSLKQRIADLEGRLKTVSGDDRAALIQQLDTLTAEAARQDAAVADSQAALATTPMHFDYYGRGGEPGFHGNPIREAWRTFVDTVVTIVTMLLRALAVLLPLALLGAVLILLWRTRPVRAVRRWLKGDRAEGNE